GEHLGSYLYVVAGFLGMKEYYIPFNAITEVHDNAVFVNAAKDDLGSMGWDQRPEDFGETETTTTTYAGATGTSGYERAGDTRHYATDTDDQTLQLREEELHARKSSVETGSVVL